MRVSSVGKGVCFKQRESEVGGSFEEYKQYHRDQGNVLEVICQLEAYWEHLLDGCTWEG